MANNSSQKNAKLKFRMHIQKINFIFNPLS
jgi:hypothetical protein